MSQDEEDIKQRARDRAREVLSRSSQFRALPRAEQLAVYRDTVESEMMALRGSDPAAEAFAMEMASPTDTFERGIDAGAGLIDKVDFPSFVKDLLKAVFDANLNVTREQMLEYRKLLKEATQSVSSFISKVDDREAFSYLVDKFPSDFSLTIPEEDDKGNLTLADKSGKPVDIGSNEVKARIMDAKLQLAREQRGMLRETLMMGVQRLVVDSGTVKANVAFSIDISQNTVDQQKGVTKSQSQKGSTKRGGFFSFYGSGGSEQSTTSNIKVTSTKTTSSTDLAAQMAGSVEINFKSDYFKMDNFVKIITGEDADTGGTPGA
ncbi:MAG: hypothetical protein KDK70_16930 [Myxococcales bacterium]|nr:hypothetical protein [Myxococcales bacterium]